MLSREAASLGTSFSKLFEEIVGVSVLGLSPMDASCRSRASNMARSTGPRRGTRLQISFHTGAIWLSSFGSLLESGESGTNSAKFLTKGRSSGWCTKVLIRSSMELAPEAYVHGAYLLVDRTIVS
jgi:hypothetical protein